MEKVRNRLTQVLSSEDRKYYDEFLASLPVPSKESGTSADEFSIHEPLYYDFLDRLLTIDICADGTMRSPKNEIGWRRQTSMAWRQRGQAGGNFMLHCIPTPDSKKMRYGLTSLFTFSPYLFVVIFVQGTATHCGGQDRNSSWRRNVDHRRRNVSEGDVTRNFKNMNL